MQKILIIFGILFIIVGILLPWFQRAGIGHLPGDLVIKKEQFTFYFPLMTSILLSVIMSLILWFFKK